MIQVRNWLLSAAFVVFCLSLFAPGVGTAASDVSVSQDTQVASACSPCICTKYCKTKGTAEQTLGEKQATIVRKCQPGDTKCTIQKYGTEGDVKVAVDRCPQNAPNCGGTRPTRNATASA